MSVMSVMNESMSITHRTCRSMLQTDSPGLVRPKLARYFSAAERERSGTHAGGRAETVRAVDLLDPSHRRYLASGLTGIGKEFERPGADHRVGGDDLCRFKIPLESRVLHELRSAGVGESLAADGVADKALGDFQLKSR